MSFTAILTLDSCESPSMRGAMMRPLHRNSSGQNQDKETATLIQTCQGEGTHLVVSTLILIRSLRCLIGGLFKEGSGYTAFLHVPRE